jgi:hypothetical protein
LILANALAQTSHRRVSCSRPTTATAEANTAGAAVPFLKAFAEVRAKAGRALGAANAEHVAEINKALDSMAAASTKAATAGRALITGSPRLTRR